MKSIDLDPTLSYIIKWNLYKGGKYEETNRRKRNIRRIRT